MMKKKNKQAHQEGSLLILVMVFLAMMGFFALAVGRTVQQRLDVISRLEARDQLRLIAESGVRRGMQVIREKVDSDEPDALNQTWSHQASKFKDIKIGQGKFTLMAPPLNEGSALTPPTRYGLADEESKININLTKSPEVLIRLFELSAKISHQDAQMLAYSFLDWVDDDDDSYDLGVEKKYYLNLNPPYTTKNQKLGAIEELLAVRGMTPEILEKIRPYVTLTGTNEININTASAVVLMAIGLNESVVKKMIDYRRGRDKVLATPDDTLFEDTQSILEKLKLFTYLDEPESENLTQIIQSQPLSVRSEIFSAHSVAQLNFGHQILTVNAVISKTGDILKWEEDFSQVAFSS